MGPDVVHPATRKIIHVDMDCFYAAVELRERPELAGRPVAVGGGSRRGVVTTCNYEARKFGVHSAMPGFMARERCPQLVFLPLRFDLYREESQKIRAILRRHTPLVEPLSLDEAYLDVTASDRFAWDIARNIRAEIRAETGLTASAGVAANKMLAKIASDWRKPDGQFAILPEQTEAFMRDLPIRKVWGIGPKSAERFAAQGIHTCGDLQGLPLVEMVARHGKWGEELYRLCRGLDDRRVQPHRVRKSLSNESTFSENLPTLAACRDQLSSLAEELLAELREKAADRAIRKAFVKIKYADFTRTTRECLCTVPTPEVFLHLLAQAHARKSLPVRLLGTGVRFAEAAPDAEGEQLELFA
ncbi:MAG TPA: DNA polymerase IV [Chthoniobacterales bacterium]|jgi:DNA polymerase-4